MVMYKWTLRSILYTVISSIIWRDPMGTHRNRLTVLSLYSMTATALGTIKFV